MGLGGGRGLRPVSVRAPDGVRCVSFDRRVKSAKKRTVAAGAMVVGKVDETEAVHACGKCALTVAVSPPGTFHKLAGNSVVCENSGSGGFCG